MNENLKLTPQAKHSLINRLLLRSQNKISQHQVNELHRLGHLSAGHYDLLKKRGYLDPRQPDTLSKTFRKEASTAD